MPELAFKIIGWTGQALFFSRFLTQWYASEKQKRIVVPPSFWGMSFAGACCSFLYAFHREQLVFMAAPSVNVFLYARNLFLARSGKGLKRGTLACIAAGIAALLLTALSTKLNEDPSPWWMGIGILGASLWISRFPLQWWISERRGEPQLPTSFFLISLIGGLASLAYAIHLEDAIFIAAFALSPFLYSRTLFLSLRRP